MLRGTVRGSGVTGNNGYVFLRFVVKNFNVSWTGEEILLIVMKFCVLS